jgi:hypothetical protein
MQKPFFSHYLLFCLSISLFSLPQLNPQSLQNALEQISREESTLIDECWERLWPHEKKVITSAALKENRFPLVQILHAITVALSEIFAVAPFDVLKATDAATSPKRIGHTEGISLYIAPDETATLFIKRDCLGNILGNDIPHIPLISYAKTVLVVVNKIPVERFAHAAIGIRYNYNENRITTTEQVEEYLTRLTTPPVRPPRVTFAPQAEPSRRRPVVTFRPGVRQSDKQKQRKIITTSRGGGHNRGRGRGRGRGSRKRMPL